MWACVGIGWYKVLNNCIALLKAWKTRLFYYKTIRVFSVKYGCVLLKISLFFLCKMHYFTYLCFVTNTTSV